MNEKLTVLRLRRRIPICLLLAAVALTSCRGRNENPNAEPQRHGPTTFNLAHLDHLGEDVQVADSTLRIIHIYSEAPDYGWVGDEDEGIACVDDAARAAIVYLRHYELTGDVDSLDKARSLLRFLMYMQSDGGLFYNFVWDNTLRINTEHQNSVPTEFGWWDSRAVWALGTAARVLKAVDPHFARQSADRVNRALPHLRALLDRYEEVEEAHGRVFPLWLVHSYASDATSEMLLGLIGLNEAYPSARVDSTIRLFADGMALMQYGTFSSFPYGAHASYLNEWHGWGNSQTQALASAGIVESAVREAESFYPRLLIEGWLHSFRLDDPDSGRRFSQIAYAVRCMAVGLVRLHERTGDVRYAKMAGLAASWFAGNNVAEVPMYDPATGRGYDGINGPDDVNRNAGAESTIEALMTILEVEHVQDARLWMTALGGEAGRIDRNDDRLLFRVFTAVDSAEGLDRRIGLVADLAREELRLLEGEELDEFLRKATS